MAEFVDSRMERALRELEQMVKVGLFTSQEIKSIVTKRMKLEYAVGRHEKSVEDHLKYVKHEMSFLELIKLRRKRLGYDFKFKEIEGSVGQRCQLRLMRAEGRHPNSMEIWKLHVELCRVLKWNPIASQVFTRMLQIHSDKPDVWKEAADFELNENGSPDSARELCLKALRWHEKNPEMWRHHLTVELSIASKVFQRAHILGVSSANIVKGDDPIATGKLAMAVVRSAVQTIPTVDFAASLYETVQNTKRRDNLPEEFCEPLSDFILQQMEEAYSALPSYWKHRARFCLLPVTVRGSEEEDVTEEEMIRVEKEAFDVLDTAIGNCDSDSMWQSYMDFLAELYTANGNKYDSWGRLARKRSEKALSVFQRAEKSGAVDFHRYLSWARILVAQRKPQEALGCLAKASAILPMTLDAFVNLIDLYGAVSGDSQLVIPLIQKAKEVLSKNNPEFWRCLVSWTLQYQPDDAEILFKDALRQTRPVVAAAALLYVQWSYGKSASRARKVLEEVRKTPGAFTQSLVKWVLAEELRRKAPIALLRKLLDQALAVHGVESADFWIDYIQLELTYPGGDALKSSKMVWKAQRTLKPEAVALFMSMYNLIMLDDNST